jgi:chorismate mutase/prephenate dehydratase
MDIEALRSRINEIDDELAKLFVRRMETALEIAKYKKENNIPVLNRARERDVLNRVTDITGEEMEEYTKILYNTLFDLSRSYQNRFLAEETRLAADLKAAIENAPEKFPTKAVVACQGVEGAYSQLACEKIFSLPSIMYINTFEGVFQAVEKGLCRYGILPIENSSYGSVTQVYDLMRRYKFFIVRSIKMRINHTLLSKSGTSLSDVREIFSHEQALGQCSEFLKKMTGVKITVVENTAAAAKMVAESERDDVAAISSQNCASLYGLSVLSEEVQNSDNNYTRFICISKNLEIYPGADRISLMLSVPHKPGALYEMIAKFSALGLNLTKLESRPLPGREFEFMFYFDFSAAVNTPEVVRLLCELESRPELFVFLGSYSEI